MSWLFIHTRNGKFHACDEGAEYQRPEDAMAMGVQGAIALLADEIQRGEQNAAIEISIETNTGTQVLRSVMSVCVSSLMPNPPGTVVHYPEQVS